MYVIEFLMDRKATAWAEFCRLPSLEEADETVVAMQDEECIAVRRRKVDA